MRICNLRDWWNCDHTEAYILFLIDNLETIDTFLSIVPPLEEQLLAGCSKTLEQVWTILDNTLELYDKNYKVSERACAVIRRGLQFFGPLCSPLLVNIVNRMTLSYERSGCPSFLWITAKVISASAETRNHTLESCLKAAFERQSAQAFTAIKEAGSEHTSDGIVNSHPAHLGNTLI